MEFKEYTLKIEGLTTQQFKRIYNDLAKQRDTLSNAKDLCMIKGSGYYNYDKLISAKNAQIDAFVLNNAK